MTIKDDAYGTYINVMEGTRDRRRAIDEVTDMVAKTTLENLAKAIAKIAPEVGPRIKACYAEYLFNVSERDDAFEDLMKVMRADNSEQPSQ